MAFVNRFRLPFKITRPQFQEARDIFSKANGVTVVLNSVIRKRYEGETDHWPEKLHERFKIALSHDNVTIEGEKYMGGVVQDGDYTINWTDFLDYPLAKGQFFVFVTPFEASNSNCGACEDFIQVVANDDIVPGVMIEGQGLQMNVLANDDVCCDPVEIFIVSYNTDYVAGASINLDNNFVGFTMKEEFASQAGVILVTYRVQCANGQYDEANIIADVVGSVEPPCESAVNINIAATDVDAVAVDWDAPTNPPANGYEWELYEAADLGVAVQTGTTTDTEVSIGGLTPGTAYRFYLRSACAEDSFSDWQYIEFSTQAEDQPPICGRYRVTNPVIAGLTSFQYMDCNGTTQTVPMGGAGNREVCMLQNSPGSPVYFQGNSFMTLTYLGTC